MEMLTRVPDAVIGYLKTQKRIDASSMLIGMACRAHMPGSGGVYLFADNETLNILEGVTCVECEGRNTASVFAESAYSSYAFDEITNLDIEELVSGVRLSFDKKSGTSVLAVEASNTFKEALSLFMAYLNRIMNDEFTGVEEEDCEKYCENCGRRFPDKHNICPYCADNRGVLKKLLPFFKRYMGKMIAMSSMLVAISLFGVISPYISNSFYIDKVLSEGGEFYGRVVLALLMLLSIKLADVVITVINDVLTAKIGANITYDLKKTIFSSINRLSLGFFTSRRTGSLMTQVESDSSTLYNFFSEMTPNLIVSLVKIVAIIGVMLYMEPILALVTVVIMPIYIFMLTKAFKKSRRMAVVHFSKMKALSSRVSDVLSGMRVVKVFAKEKEEGKRFKRLSLAKNDVYYQWTMYDTAVYTAIEFVLYIATVAVWAIGGMLVFKGRLSYGSLLTFVAYMGMVYSPLNFIIRCLNRLGDSFNAATRLFEIYDAIPDVMESPEPVIIEKLKGDIEFCDVSFSYTKSKKTIDSVSFKVPAGKTLGIVGRTGSGKSTLVNLLIRLYDVNDGKILIDGINVKDMSFEQLRKNVAIVSQETYLFAGTIFENIAYSIKNASQKDVINAAIEAGAHDFIMKLPDAYETRIGFGYKDLSGGERQRISIARALLKKPKILILDEATAAMDTVTEQRIDNAIEKLKGRCTTIMIAHRLSTLKGADSLIAIENGRIVESGTHTELLSLEDGIYKKLYTLQLEALRNIINDGDDVKVKLERMPPMRAMH